MGIPDSGILPCLIKMQILVYYLCIFNANSNSLPLFSKSVSKIRCVVCMKCGIALCEVTSTTLISGTVEQLPGETLIKMASFKKLFGEEHVRL